MFFYYLFTSDDTVFLPSDCIQKNNQPEEIQRRYLASYGKNDIEYLLFYLQQHPDDKIAMEMYDTRSITSSIERLLQDLPFILKACLRANLGYCLGQESLDYFDSYYLILQKLDKLQNKYKIVLPFDIKGKLIKYDYLIKYYRDMSKEISIEDIKMIESEIQNLGSETLNFLHYHIEGLTKKLHLK